MKPSEACSSGASRTTYGITINISPYYKVEGKQWRKHDNSDQKAIIISIYKTLVMSYTQQEVIETDYVFELTQKNNIHLHSVLTCMPAEIKLMQQDVYKNYSYKKDPLERVFNYSPTIIHVSFWKTYMQKMRESPLLLGKRQ